MYPAPIQDYVAPKTVDEALKAIASLGEDAQFIAGGQSLMQAVKSRLVQPSGLVDLQHVSELKGVSGDGGGVRIGAMTRYVEIADANELDGAFAALRDAAIHVGDRQVRNRGTIGGSLCWNYIAACMPAVAIGLGAEMELVSSGGSKRTLSAEDFIGAPLETALEDGEIMSSINLAAPAANTGSAYSKWGLVQDALPVIGMCARVEVDGSGACTAARIGIGGLATGPRMASGAAAALIGKSAGDEAGIEAALATAADETETQSDMWADSDYRKQLIRSTGKTVVLAAIARAQGAGDDHPHVQPLTI
jgi:carbon-monoxide dehydrogenase medium subunit